MASKRLKYAVGIGVAAMALLVFVRVSRNGGSAEDTAYAQEQDYDRGRELLENPGFEKGGSPPAAWSQDVKQTGNEGAISWDTRVFHAGMASLRLEPNKKNKNGAPLAVSQLISAGDVQGRQVEVSGYVRAEGEATAIIGLLSIVGGTPKKLEMLFQPSSGGADWTLQKKIYDVPAGASQLAVICMVNGKSGAAGFDDLSLVALTPRPARANPGTAQPDAAPAPNPNSAGVKGGALTAHIEVDAGKVVREIPRTLFGANIEWRWDATSLWKADENRADPALVREARDLGLSLIRYPGGIYSDFYHWKDGIGPVKSRPEIVHEPGKQDKSRPHFGTDEALQFADQTGAALWITVNLANGTPEEAADWVRYVNRNGHRVHYWEVGNEEYINDGSPVSKAVTIDPNTYAAKFLLFAKAMRAADPTIEIAAIGGENHGRYSTVSYPNWDQIVLSKAGDQIDLLSVHNGYAPLVLTENTPFRTAYRAMYAAPVLFAHNLEVLARQIEQYAPPGHASKIRIAVTEWGPAFRFDLASRWSDHNKTLGSALYAASAMKAMIESPRTDVAAFWMLNDFSVLGWIADAGGKFPPAPDWIPTARYYALQLFTKHFGEQLVKSEAQGPAFDTDAVGLVDAVRSVPWLDVVSSLSADGKTLYVMGINRQFDDAIQADIDLHGFVPSGQGTAWTLNGTGTDANTGSVIIRVPGLKVPKQAEDERNPRFSKGSMKEVTVTSSDFTVNGSKLSYSFPAHSVTSLAISRGR